MPRRRANEVTIARAARNVALTEWWRNDADGIEQGFTLAVRPDGDGPLRTREADLQKHLNNGTEAAKGDQAMTDAQRAAEQQRDEAREAARKRLEEEAKKNPNQRLVPEFGTDKDFQLTQALNQLKGQPVLISKTLSVRTEEKKEN